MQEVRLREQGDIHHKNIKFYRKLSCTGPATRDIWLDQKGPKSLNHSVKKTEVDRIERENSKIKSAIVGAKSRYSLIDRGMMDHERNYQ